MFRMAEMNYQVSPNTSRKKLPDDMLSPIADLSHLSENISGNPSNHYMEHGNGELESLCNGKNSTDSHISLFKSKGCTETDSESSTINYKKTNGLIQSELYSGDKHTIISKNHVKSMKGQNTYCQCEEPHPEADPGKSESNFSLKNEEDEDQSSLKDNSVDVMLDRLENISVNVQSKSNLGNEIVHGKDSEDFDIDYVVYESEKQMPDIMRLITKDLSEPYSIYTYRYFIHNWPKLCFLAKADDKCVGAIVCKLDLHKKMARRGYIAMLAVDSEYRRRQIGSTLVTKAIEAMIHDECDEVVLETEITNQGALRLYENLGFVRDKRLFRYYLNGVDALRLKLWLR